MSNMASEVPTGTSEPIMNGGVHAAPQGEMAHTDTNAPNGANTATAPGLSADEIALYDRQIRLWGAQAQERIRSANILLISLRALGTEIAKNLTLAGIRSLTIIDDEPASEDDLGAGYFLREEDIGKPVSAPLTLCQCSETF
jgi:ubiquitin-like 1-activating enzyme E1 A